MKNVLKKISWPYIIVFICLIYLIIVMYVFRNPFVSHYQLEAGSSLNIQDLLKEDVSATFVTKIDESIIRQVGVHDIKLKAKGGTYTVPVEVVDTVAPQAKVLKPTLWLNDPIQPQSFVDDIRDETNVKVSLVHEIEARQAGQTNVEVLLTDAAGNKTTYQTQATIKKDTQGPKITAPSSIVVKKGGTIAYKKGVRVIDNRDGEIEKYDIDSSQVNLNKIGTYRVTYTAKDSLGNKTKKVIQVRVIAYDLAEVKKSADQYADKIIKQLGITKQTSKKQKLDKIYEYVRTHYKYNGQHEGTIDDFYKDALTGFETGQGDCYVVNAMARYLLEKVNIETYGLVLHGTDMDHISFMVNLGDGWYHYCAFKKKSGIRIYKYTDKQMIEHYKQFGITSIPNTVPKTPKK